MTRIVKVKKMLSEDQEQTMLVNFLAKIGVRCYAVPNGGYRNALEGAKFKRTGVKSGVPDLCIPLASGSHHGLYIEMKRSKGGKLSDAQIDWLTYLRSAGYYAEVAHGFDEAREIVLHYLSLTPKAA